MRVITFSAAAAAAGTAVGVVADRVANADTYFSMGAALAVILGFFVVPVWRAFRRAQKERQHQTVLLTSLHAAMYGRAENRDEGVAAVVGVVDRLGKVETQLAEGTQPMHQLTRKFDDFTFSTTQSLERHETQIAEARRAAGHAATAAATATDRLEFLNDRIWERFEGLTIRNEMLTGLMQEAGYEVGEMPPLDASG